MCELLIIWGGGGGGGNYILNYTGITLIGLHAVVYLLLWKVTSLYRPGVNYVQVTHI